MQIKVVSYNILANAYTNPEWYQHIDAQILKWSYRKIALGQKVEQFQADVICLQEVEPDAFETIAHTLNPKGYQGLYAKKLGAKADGCATFINATALNYQASQTVYYQDSDREDPHSGHLAMISTLENQGHCIKIVNTHLKWDNRNKQFMQHLGYRQIKQLLDNYIKLDSKTSWIMCGDFNAEPNSQTIEAVSRHGFQDAYAKQAQFTCNPNRKAKRIDYIFHTDKLIAQPESIKEIDNLTPLPAPGEPSDHLPLVVNFLVKE